MDVSGSRLQEKAEEFAKLLSDGRFFITYRWRDLKLGVTY